GLDTSAPILFQSDTNFSNDASGITATSTGDSILVRLVSDTSVSCGSGSGSPDLNFDVFCSTCVPPTGSVDVVEDCAVSGGFNIEITLTDLGTSTSFTISDDQGSPSQNVNVTGTYTFGPYTNGTLVAISVDSDQDANCSDTFSDLTQVACPPSNDDCANAITITPGETFDTNPIVGTNLGATDSGELPLPGCASYDPADPTGFGGDLWYAVTVPVDGNLTIQTNANPTGNGGDSGMAVYSGSCGSLALVECDDDDSPDGAYSQVVIEPIDGLAGQVVYARVWEFSGNAQIDFQISAYSATLSTNEFENLSSLRFYPNPVNNVVNFEAQKSIEQITLFNMLGQSVLTAKPNALSSELDISDLQTGTYFVKVTIDGASKTVRVVKQ
ncbi:MAG: T9SS type A sorting domain-containing protein, partial [Winogradskyella sp.]|nr:T9SS type A sorting domain-containing protein [Winogradskyella sp.]